MTGHRFIITMLLAVLLTGMIPAEAADPPVHMMLDCPRAIVDGTMKQIDESNEAIVPFLADDTTMVPIRFLAELLGYQIAYEEQTQTAILKGARTIVFQNGSKSFTVDDLAKNMTRAAEERQGRMFVPVRVVCEALDCTVGWNNELISIYPAGNKTFLSDEQVRIVAKQLRTGEITNADPFLMIQERLVKDVYSATADPADILLDLQEDGSFKSIHYQDTRATGWEPQNHISNALTMVKAAYSPGNPLYGDEALKQKCALVLTYWAEHDFTCVNNTWFTTIGIPSKLADILLFDVEGLSVDVKQKLEEITKRGYLVVDQMKNPTEERRSDSQGGNLTDLIVNSLKIAVATQDKEFISTLSQLLDNELRVFPGATESTYWQDSEGIKADYSFWQHKRLPCFGSYGGVFVSGVNKLLYYLEGTEYMVSDAALDHYTRLILEGLQWAVVGDYIDYTVNGRSIARVNGTRTLRPSLKKACEVLLELEGTPRKEEIRTLYEARFAGEDQGIRGHKHFWKSDYTAHKGPGYHIGIRATSDRSKPTERINGENALGYYLGDGATVLMRTGEEFLNIFPVWDWNKIPGTTTAQNTLPVEEDETVIWEWVGSSPFAGGVTDGKNGATTMDYDRDGVKAHKSWFMVDKIMLALGSGITSENNNEIVTTVNQTLHNGDYSINSGAVENGKFVTGLSWIEHDKIGYIFPEGGNVAISAKEQTGSWRDISVVSGKEDIVKNDVFTVEINHGVKPKDAKYSYLVVMNADKEETKQVAENSPFEILQNDETIQAVRQSEKQIVQAVFRQPGTLRVSEEQSISVDRPCMVMLDEMAGTLTVANPYNKKETVEVKINNTKNANNKTRVFTLPGGENAGQSVTMTLEN